LSSSAVRNRKVTTLRPASGNPRIRLVCVPHAGGNPEIFLPWADGLSPDVELLALRLPGHGPRIADPPIEDWDALLADLLEGLEDYLSEPHAFYGHCFGGRLAYELTHLTRAHDHAQTTRLFVSACRSPDTRQAGRYVHDLPDAEFLEELRRRGASDQVLQNKTILRFVLPNVRNEIRLAELWTDRHQAAVNVPITAIYGSDDAEDDRSSMEGWHAFSTEGCELIETQGGHSFFERDPSSLLEVINARLEHVVCKS
jgi:medium-chain acyl-[acyl-carrier-protein] hydrolase